MKLDIEVMKNKILRKILNFKNITHPKNDKRTNLGQTWDKRII